LSDLHESSQGATRNRAITDRDPCSALLLCIGLGRHETLKFDYSFLSRTNTCHAVCFRQLAAAWWMQVQYRTSIHCYLLLAAGWPWHLTVIIMF